MSSLSSFKINKGDIEDAIFELSLLISSFKKDKEYSKTVELLAKTVADLETKKAEHFKTLKT